MEKENAAYLVGRGPRAEAVRYQLKRAALDRQTEQGTLVLSILEEWLEKNTKVPAA